MQSWLGPRLFGDPTTGTVNVYGDGTPKIRYVAVSDVAELALQSLTTPAARNAIIPFGGPEELSQRDVVRIFEGTYGRPFAAVEVPEPALDARWRSAEDPFEKSFAALLLGVARGLDSGMQPPFESFPIRMITVKDFVRSLARPGRVRATS